MQSLCDSVRTLKGVGQQSADKLATLGIYTLAHLLFHLPARYQDKTHFTSLKDCALGVEALFELEVESVEQVYGKRPQLLCRLGDGQHTLVLRFFHFTAYQKHAFIRGEIVQCFGEIVHSRQGAPEILHPEYRLISQNQSSLLEAAHTPVYPLGNGLRQGQLKRWIARSLEVARDSPLTDYLTALNPALLGLSASLKVLHHPKTTQDIAQIAQFTHPAQQRLIVEELCVQRLGLLQLKQRRKTRVGNVFTLDHSLDKQLNAQLSFTLTKAQRRCIEEIKQDMQTPAPMMRLLQGDVGSGKTIVAIFACLEALGNGFQVAMMAPTQILAEQHLKSIAQQLKSLDITLAALNGAQTKAQQTQQLARIASGQANIVIGTHALFQAKVVFANLGLVIIDEQHKFGVHQRLLLSQKAHNTPHQLIMTATPIPRSLTMSAYADLDLSIIDELPPLRQPIQTIVLNTARKTEVVEKIKQICASNQQVYWVCTLIEASETLRAESAEQTHQYLVEHLPELSVVLIHGRLHQTEKTQIMHAFTQGKIQVLVATTVIEVGVDVPNASLMVVENAERLGLAQLHQLRGRVGRGMQHSLCILMYQPPLSQNARARLEVLRQSQDGFVIAQKDLELRGPGEILGTQQTGLATLKIANIVRDGYLLKQAGYLSEQCLTLDEASQRQLMARWIDPHKTQYANA